MWEKDINQELDDGISLFDDIATCFYSLTIMWFADFFGGAINPKSTEMPYNCAQRDLVLWHGKRCVLEGNDGDRGKKNTTQGHGEERRKTQLKSS